MRTSSVTRCVFVLAVLLTLVTLAGQFVPANAVPAKPQPRNSSDRLLPGQVDSWPFLLASGATIPGVTGGSFQAQPNPTSQMAGNAKEWCDRVTGGPEEIDHSLPVALSAAHASVREFGMASPFQRAGRALAQALSDRSALTRPGLAAAVQMYAAVLEDVCAFPASWETLGPARVEMVDGVVFVRPGEGKPDIPADSRLVVLDLRDLPEVEGLDAALARALAPALASPVPQGARLRRSHVGPVDEVVSPNNVYSTSVELEEQPPLAAAGSRDIPLVLLTSERMAPQAAEFAGALRMAGRAWLLGEDVFAEVAEADWRGVAQRGLAIRTAFLVDQIRQGEPRQFPDQTAAQDDPVNLATASYRGVLDLADNTRLVEVTVDGQDGTDLDLFLMHDANGDGVFAFPSERVAASTGSTADEHVRSPVSPRPGRYQVWVHGYTVPDHGRQFDLTVGISTGRLWPDINLMQMLVGAQRLTSIVGQRSAGTNGNITGVQLPGGFAFTYTGMRVLNPDGTRFHGIGILPDIQVPLAAADLRDGVDRDLLTAIEILAKPTAARMPER